MNKNHTVLLAVDIQEQLMQGRPYNWENVLGNIGRLISICRQKGIEVVYVRHDDGIGSELGKGTPGWQICSAIAPQSNERIFDKNYNSAFLKTGLKDYLDSKEVKNIILVGMQTEYCIDATCKSAFEQGFTVIFPEEANTTFDNEFMTGKQTYEFYMKSIWKNHFAQVLPIEELEKGL